MPAILDCDTGDGPFADDDMNAVDCRHVAEVILEWPLSDSDRKEYDARIDQDFSSGYTRSAECKACAMHHLDVWRDANDTIDRLGPRLMPPEKARLLLVAATLRAMGE